MASMSTPGSLPGRSRRTSTATVIGTTRLPRIVPALEAAQRLGDLHAQAIIHCCLACAYCRLDRHGAANEHLQQALELYEILDDFSWQGPRAPDPDLGARPSGALREALAHAEQAVELFRIAGRPTGQARSLNAVGWFHIQLGDPEQGLRDCQHALDMQRDNR